MSGSVASASGPCHGEGTGEKEAEPSELELAPHDGVVVLDDTPQGQVITHLQTLERRYLPQGHEWVLAFDDHGYGAVAANSSDSVLLLEDWLAFNIGVTPDGSLVVLRTNEPGARLKRLVAWQRCYQEIKTYWRNDGDFWGIDFVMYVVEWQRQGSHYFVDVLQLYKLLNLNSYKGEASKWAYEMIPSWGRILTSLRMSGQILKSGVSAKAGEVFQDSERFLPKPSVSVRGLLALVWRWGASPVRCGGIRDESSRLRALSLAMGMVKSICAAMPNEAFVMTLDFDDDWECRSPRPPRALNIKAMPVDTGGGLDVSAWRDEVSSGAFCARSAKMRWWGLVERLGGMSGGVSLVDLLQQAEFSDPGFAGFYAQILHGLGERAERILQAHLTGDAADESLSCEATGDDPTNPRSVDMALASHVAAAQAKTSGTLHTSLAVDKANVRGLNLQNAVMVLPDNVGFVLTPAVVSAFTPNEEVNGQVDKATAQIEEAKRASAFLKRKAGDADASYRPKKRWRKAAAKYLRDLDNQVRATTGYGGLKYWNQRLSGNAWGSWKEWPHLNICNDQGSDDKSGMFALCYHTKLKSNVTAWWDPAHGSWRDTLRMIKSCGHFAFTLLGMVVFNLPHGPDQTDTRHQQMVSAMAHHFEVATPSTSPLFSALAPDMMEEMKGQYEVPEGVDPIQALWSHIKGASARELKGYKCNLNRFHSVISEGAKLLGKASYLLFKVQYLCIEMDFLNSRVWNYMLQVQLRGRDPQAQESTSSGTLDDKALRSTGANAAVIAMLVLSNPDSRRLLAMIVHAGMSAQRWHSHSNRELRDCARSKLWLIAELESGFAVHLHDVFMTLSAEEGLRTCGFLLVSDSAAAHMREEQVMHDNDHAETFGNLVLSLVSFRARRCLWMFLPPVSMAQMLSQKPGVAHSAVCDLKQMLDDFEALQAIPRPSALAKTYIARHPGNLLAVEQLRLGFEEGGWSEHNQAVMDVVHERFNCIMTTQSVEDCNNIQKNFRQQTGWGGRLRRPETSMHAALASEFLYKQHRFNALPPTVATEPEILDSSDFNAKGEPSIPTSCIVSTNSTSPYFSPAAENCGIAWADKAVIRDALDREDPSLISQTWQGFWALSTHSLVFRIQRGETNLYGWHIALHHFTDSAVLALPVFLRTPPGYQNDSDVYIDPLKKLPVAIPVTNMSEVIAFRIEWRGWAYQVQKFPAALGKWCPAVRGFRAGPPESVLRCAARAGWWSLGRGILNKIAAHLGVEKDGDDMFQLLFRLTREVMGDGLDDDAILDLLRHRLKSLAQKTHFTQELLAIDEAVTCLDEADQDEVRAAQKDAKQRQVEHRDFKNSYRERKAKVRVARAKTAVAKRAAKKVQWQGPTRMPPLASMTQAVAKQMMPPAPPKSWLWRAHTQGAWMSRVLDMPVCSRSDSAHGGDMAALRLVVQDAWRNWLTLQGWSESDCPIEGMFDVVDPRTSGRAQGSGASGSRARAVSST